MSIKTWKIESLEYFPRSEGLDKKVHTVHWRLINKENSFVTSVCGVTPLTHNEEEEFTPFEDLTEELVVEWTKIALGEEKVSQLEETVDLQLLEMMTPSSVTVQFPWPSVSQTPSLSAEPDESLE